MLIRQDRYVRRASASIVGVARRPLALLGAVASLLLGGAVHALPNDPAWGSNLNDGAFAPENRRGPNPVHAVAPVNPDVGSPGGRLQSDGGSVSGNYHLSIPLLGFPGRGLNLTLTAQYNSQIWSTLAEPGSPMFGYDLDGDWPVPGWNFGFGKLVFPNNPIFIEANGTRRSIPKVDQEMKDGRYTGRVTGRFVDGSGGSVECPVGSEGCNKSPHLAYVKLDNGGSIEMLSVTPGNVVESRVYYPQKIVDANGNFIQISYRTDAAGAPNPPNIDHITDTVGRVIQFHYDSRGLPIAISGPDQGGGRRVYARFYYQQFTSVLPVPSVGIAGVRSTTANFPVLEALVFPGNKTGYVFSDFKPFGIAKTVSVNRNMGMSTSSLTEQGTFAPGSNTNRSSFDYPDDSMHFVRRKSLPGYSQRVDTWDDPVSATTGQATTKYEVANEISSVILPDASRSVQATIAVDPERWDYGLADWTRTEGSDGKWLKTVQYVWEQGDKVGSAVVPRLKEVRVQNHEINAVQRTEFHYGASNRQVTEEIQYAYALPQDINQAAVTSRKLRQYLSQPEYAARNFNLVSQYSVFDGNASINPAYVQWQQQLAQLQQALDQAKRDAVGPQQAVTAAQAAYDTEAANEPEPTIENSHGAQIPNPLHRAWKLKMAKLQAALDAAIADAAASQQVLRLAQSSYDSVAASAPAQILAHEIERSSFQYDTGSLIALNPKPVGYSPISDSPAPRGLLTQATRWLAPDAKAISEANGELRAISTAYTYDEAGNLREVRVSPTSATTYAYEAGTQYSLPRSVSRGATDPASPASVSTRTDYDFATGLTLATTDADRQLTRTTYQPGSSGWRVASVRSPTGVTASYKYQDAFLSVETTLADGEGRKYLQTSRIDGRGLLRDVRTRRRSGGAHDIQEYRYDAMGRKTQVLATRRSSESLPARWTQLGYDAAGRLASVKEPDGSVSTLFYNESALSGLARGRLGDSVRSVDPWQRERWSLSDAAGRTLLSVQPDPASGKVADPGGVALEYQYDAQGRPLWIRQYQLSGSYDAQLRTFRYDSLGRLVGSTVPEREATLDVRGAYHEVGGSFSDVYAYDDLSNQIAHTDARGARSNRHYDGDALNRVQRIDYDLSGVGDSSSPVVAVPPTTFAYVAAAQGDPRRLQTVTTQGVLQEGGTYDAFGRQATRSWAFPGLGATWQLATESHYDSLGRPLWFRYPARYVAGQSGNGPRIDYRYTLDGELAEVDLDGAALVRNIDNGVLGVRHMDLFNGGVRIGEDQAFDPLSGRVTQQSVSGPNQQKLLQLGYVYRDASHSGETGQILVQTDLLDVQQRRRNEYDAWGRLTSSYQGAEPATGDTSRQEYGYDSFGNRTASTGSRFAPDLNTWVRRDELADGTGPYVATKSNRVVAPGFLHDKAGNLIRRPDDAGALQRYVYDAAERLVRVENAAGTLLEAYLYGADRRRIGTSPDLINWRLSLWSAYTELGRYDRNPADATLSWLDMPIYLGGRLLAELSRQGGASALTTLHQDQRGTALTTTVAGGTLVARRQSLRPFGTENAATAAVDGERRFTSYRRSARTGLDYAVNRFYDPRLGRFIQTDPAWSGQNLYAYAAGDPANMIDPSGLEAKGSNGCGTLPGDRWVWGTCVGGLPATGAQAAGGSAPGGDWGDWTTLSPPPLLTVDQALPETPPGDPSEWISWEQANSPVTLNQTEDMLQSLDAYYAKLSPAERLGMLVYLHNGGPLDFKVSPKFHSFLFETPNFGILNAAEFGNFLAGYCARSCFGAAGDLMTGFGGAAWNWIAPDPVWGRSFSDAPGDIRLVEGGSWYYSYTHGENRQWTGVTPPTWP